MTSSHSMPTPEAELAAAREALCQTTIADLAYHVHRTGVILLSVGGVGGFIGLVALSPLALLLAIVCCAAGAYLIRACQHFAPTAEWHPGQTDSGADALGQGSVLVKQLGVLAVNGLAILHQAGAWLTESIAALVRGVLKIGGCFIAGLGVGLIIVGLFALRQPELWEYDVLTRVGPPVAPLALGTGIGLVVAEMLMVALFYRPWRRGANRH